MGFQQILNGSAKLTACFRRKSDQKDPVGLFACGKYKLAEILVLCNQQGVLLGSEFEDLVILESWGDFCNRYNLKAMSAKSADDRKVAAFVGDDAHRLDGSIAWLGSAVLEARFPHERACPLQIPLLPARHPG